ncbi:hypothetical protein KHA80_17100 [Anaerobacillus sp. HL2]|nr:hypothetical protein KHA80_17100 [Anaerobacillus sp. HL2]
MQDKGFAAVLTNTTDPVFLFIGLGLDKEQAAVVAQYKANGQEVYLKPYAVGEVESLKMKLKYNFFSQV